MSNDSGFDDNSQRRAAVEHAASITALDQKAGRISTRYKQASASNTPPERTLDLPRGHKVPSVVTLDDAPPGHREALQRKLREYRKRFEDGDVLKDALRVLNRPEPDRDAFPYNVGIPVPDSNPQVAIEPHQEKAILLQLLLDNGTLNYDTAREAFGIDSEEDEHWFRQNYHLIYDYAKTGGLYVRGGTGLVETDEQEHLQEAVHKRIPDILVEAHKMAVRSDGELKPFEYVSDEGKQMRARLMRQHGHVSSDEGGVVVEMTETHKGIDVGVKEYVYLGQDWYSGHLGQTSHMYRAARLGNHLNILKEPLGNISARPDDYPDGESYRLTEDSGDEDASRQNTAFLEIVGTVGSIVDANKKTT
jgi:hypothetical protein